MECDRRGEGDQSCEGREQAPPASRRDWAALLRRVWGVDALRREGAMKLFATITDRAVIVRILRPPEASGGGGGRGPRPLLVRHPPSGQRRAMLYDELAKAFEDQGTTAPEGFREFGLFLDFADRRWPDGYYGALSRVEPACGAVRGDGIIAFQRLMGGIRCCVSTYPPGDEFYWIGSVSDVSLASRLLASFVGDGPWRELLSTDGDTRRP